MQLPTRTILFKKLKNIANRLDVFTRRPALLDLSSNKDLIEAIYLARGKSFLFDMSVTSCRGWLGLPFEKDHPYVAAVRNYMKTGDRSHRGSPLSEYYLRFQPQNAAEVHGLREHIGQFKNLPPNAAPYPWSAISPIETAEKIKRVTAHENKRRGRGAQGVCGVSRFGPISEGRTKLECDTLFNLTDSISHNGYRRELAGDDISVTLLFNTADSPIALVTAGHHRVAVLAALGATHVPVKVASKIQVRQSQVDHWPLVKAGLFSAKEADSVFSYVHSGSPGWIEAE